MLEIQNKDSLFVGHVLNRAILPSIIRRPYDYVERPLHDVLDTTFIRQNG